MPKNGNGNRTHQDALFSSLSSFGLGTPASFLQSGLSYEAWTRAHGIIYSPFWKHSFHPVYPLRFIIVTTKGLILSTYFSEYWWIYTTIHTHHCNLNTEVCVTPVQALQIKGNLQSARHQYPLYTPIASQARQVVPMEDLNMGLWGNHLHLGGRQNTGQRSPKCRSKIAQKFQSQKNQSRGTWTIARDLG